MSKIYIKNLKYVVSDEKDPTAVDLITAFDAATVKTCHEEGGVLEIEPHLLKQVTSDSQVPTEVFLAGNNITGKAVVISNTLEDLATQLNTSVTNDAITIAVKPTVVESLPNRAIMFETDLLGQTNNTETYILTRVKFSGKLSEKFNNKDKWYLPIEFFATTESKLQINQKA